MNYDVQFTTVSLYTSKNGKPAIDYKLGAGNKYGRITQQK
jgi:hypothetical protein